MIVLSAKELTKSYGTDTIIKDISFHINKGDCMGIVGVNGAGKTTLLNILSGESENYEGEFFVAKETTVGYLKQKDNFSQDDTVLGAISKVEGYKYESEVTGMLKVMSFGEEMYDRSISKLSGGEQSRLALGCLLLSGPDILLLDEPTNHLDVETIQWLEQYIKSYDGSVIVVSHDRFFLDRTVNKIMEISNHKARVYNGNYSNYAVKRKAIREAELNAYENQQKEVARQEEMIRRFKERGTSKLAKRAASREKRLAQMQDTLLEKPDGEKGKMKLTFREEFPTGKDVLLGEKVAIGFHGKALFSDLEFDVKRGDRVAVLGSNGAGKTTFLKAILGDVPLMEGRLKLGHNVAFGYYDQGQQLLNPMNTVLEEIHGAYRLYKESEIRGILGRFLFKGEDVFLRVSDLSGGEKARLALLKLMMGGANVLVLDEPTNHLDIDSKEVFEEALKDYPGTVFVVSHDRYFMEKIPTKTIDLDAHREGAKKALGEMNSTGKFKAASEAGKTSDDGNATQSALERAQKKERQAEERRLKREKEALEQKIQLLEVDILSSKEEMCQDEVLSDLQRLRDLDQQVKAMEAELEELYDRWMEIM